MCFIPIPMFISKIALCIILSESLTRLCVHESLSQGLDQYYNDVRASVFIFKGQDLWGGLLSHLQEGEEKLRSFLPKNRKGRAG